MDKTYFPNNINGNILFLIDFKNFEFHIYSITQIKKPHYVRFFIIINILDNYKKGNYPSSACNLIARSLKASVYQISSAPYQLSPPILYARLI